MDNGKKVKTNVERGSDDEGNSSGTPTEKVVEEDTSSEPFEVFQLFWNAVMVSIPIFGSLYPVATQLCRRNFKRRLYLGNGERRAPAA